VSEPLIIVGNGMAAARLVDEQLTRCALDRHTIAVIGDEPRLAYNRVLLSSVLAGETAPEAIELKPMSWWLDSPSQAQGAASLEISADVQRPASTR
jgi:nitrite reductase (NADH) large subunit